MIHRIDLLDVPRVHAFKAERFQAFEGKLGAIASIGEQFRDIGNTLPDHAADLAVQQISS